MEIFTEDSEDIYCRPYSLRTVIGLSTPSHNQVLYLLQMRVLSRLEEVSARDISNAFLQAYSNGYNSLKIIPIDTRLHNYYGVCIFFKDIHLLLRKKLCETGLFPYVNIVINDDVFISISKDILAYNIITYPRKPLIITRDFSNKESHKKKLLKDVWSQKEIKTIEIR